MRLLHPERQGEDHVVSEQGKRKPSSHFLEQMTSSGRMSSRAGAAQWRRSHDNGLRRRAIGESGDCPRDHQEPAFSECSSPILWAGHPRRSRPCRSAVQFERETLARLLLLLANLARKGNLSPLSRNHQETLAEMIGTTRSRGVLHDKFRKMGFIRYTATSKSTVHC